MRQRLITLAKIMVTVIGMALVLHQVNPADIGHTLLRTDWRWLLVTVLVFNASLVIRAGRWLLLLQGVNAPVRFSRLVELYFVGNFFNTFLPTSFGGDVVRAWQVTHHVPAGVAAGTVLLDRLLGLMALLFMSLLLLPFRPAGFPDSLVPFILGVGVVGLLAGFFLLQGGLIQRAGRWLPGVLSPVGDGFIARTLAAVRACGRPAIVNALLVSLLFNLMLAAWWWTSAHALGLDVGLGYLLLVIPILSVVLLVPSIGGLGPRELLAPLLFAGAGLAPVEAYTLSLLVFAMQRASSLLGGLWYVAATLQQYRQDRPASELHQNITP